MTTQPQIPPDNQPPKPPEGPQPLTEQALKRLRMLAEGNGLTAQDITLLKTDEKIYELKATMALVPTCETEVFTIPGPIKGKDRIIKSNFTEMRTEVAKRVQELKSDSASWLPKAVEELKTEPAEGWGIAEAKIVLPEQTTWIAASETCAACQGRCVIPCTNCQARGYIQCVMCQATGQERPCYHCGLRGTDPLDPTQPCPICRGHLAAPCRYCVKLGHPIGQIPCPVCLAKRAEPCGTCASRGMFSEETKITCSADTNFTLLTGGLPSGFNRAMDRISVMNLPKGHADVETYVPDENEMEALAENKRIKGTSPVLYYRARVPYADLRITIKKEISTISAFGKRCVLGNVPPFLDDALTLARDNLARAARGISGIESATSARVIRDSVTLHITGKNTVNDLRRLYPIGLSAEVAREITINARRAIARTTLALRLVASATIALLELGGTAYLYLTPLHAELTKDYPLRQVMIVDMAVPGLLALIGWLALGLATRAALAHKFPMQKQLLIQKIGKTGIAMIAVLIMGWAIMLYYSKPLWLMNILHR